MHIAMVFQKFPILGGRLLKGAFVTDKARYRWVSNPWREAIEEVKQLEKKYGNKVSNPWREAIEACT